MQVLSLIRGTGCDEQDKDNEDDITSECKPAKLRVVSMPETSYEVSNRRVSFGSNTLVSTAEENNGSPVVKTDAFSLTKCGK
mgnify:CR=1 FL=1